MNWFEIYWFTNFVQFYKIKKGYNKKKNVLDLNLVEINLNDKEFKMFILVYEFGKSWYENYYIKQ